MSTSQDIQLDRDIATRIAVAQELRLRAQGKGAFSVTYKFIAKDYGVDSTEVIAPPPGLRGVIRDLNLYDVSEIFNTTAAPANVSVGISGAVAVYATFANFGTLAANAGEDFALTLGATAILPADTDILVTFNASDNGTPTGIASTALTINYFL